MKKKTSIILLIITTLLGSIVSFYSINLLMSDLSNMFYGVHDAYFVSSIPLVMIAFDFVFLYIFLLRFTRYPMYKKALIKLYSLFLAITSSIGTITSIITGAVIYKSFIKPYPFTCYTLLLLILHILLLLFGLYIRIVYIKKIENDREKKHIKVKYAIYSFLIFLLILYAYNRFGALLLSPIYVQYSTLYLTFCFYLSLLIPISFLTHITIYFFDGYKDKEIISFVVISSITFVSVFVSAIVLVIGFNFPEFISAISPCLPLERLATMPIGTIAQFVISVFFGGYYVFYSYKSVQRKNKEY